MYAYDDAERSCKDTHGEGDADPPKRRDAGRPLEQELCNEEDHSEGHHIQQHEYLHGENLHACRYEQTVWIRSCWSMHIKMHAYVL